MAVDPGVRALDGRFGALKVLTGSEVDIRADGSLDYEEETLRELEVVMVAVHSTTGQEQYRMCEPRHIVNTLPLEEFLGFIRQERFARAVQGMD